MGKEGIEARFPLEEQKVIKGVPSEIQLANIQCAVSRLQEEGENVFPNVNKNISASQSKQKEQYWQRKGLDNRVMW